MSKFNLLDEPWIRVLSSEDGESKEVSLIELFENAQNYKTLAGESKTQDFAVLRLLLAVLHTVFSRFNEGGKVYPQITVDDDFRQVSRAEGQEQIDDYIDELYNTWENLWNAKKFPQIVNDYLNKWRDHFYLFDENYPFYQVTKDDIGPDKISKSKASTVSGKNINRLISESGNKISLFSPKYENYENKEILKSEEVIRWLVTFQNYTGLSDKVIFGKDKYKASKGWLFDLGGIYFSGRNFFETLMLNFIIVHSEEQYQNVIQKPCWEYSPNDSIRGNLNDKALDNLAELYTSWSRAIYIDPEIDLSKAFSFDVVKLKDLPHQDANLEPMTLWKFNKDGENKDKYTPKKHQKNKSLWRSFGLISHGKSNSGENYWQPGLIDWLDNLFEYGLLNLDFNKCNIPINAVSMEDDGNATSWVPVDEIVDSLNINGMVLTDTKSNGWINRINLIVNETKECVEVTYKRFLFAIKEIRKIDSKDFVNQNIEQMYFILDGPFRLWISSITSEDSKDDKDFEWKHIAKKLISGQAKELLAKSGPRDFKGIVVGEKVKNIATEYNSFKYFLNKRLKEKEVCNEKSQGKRN